MSTNKANQKIVVHKGAPKKRDDSGFVKIFIGLAVILSILILVFQSTINEINNGLYASGNGMSWSSAIAGLVVASLVSAIQSWIFRNNIREENRILYILSGAGGGFLGGIVAGALHASGLISGGLLIGGTIGLVAGGLSSLAQNLFMTSNDLKRKWFLYSLLSWGIICAIGWTVSWAIYSMIGTAIGAAIIVAASGIALSWSFGNSTIEF